MEAVKENHRNQVRQEIPIKDEHGVIVGKKAIFHEKKFNKSQYASHTNWWRQVNKIPRKKQ